MQPDATVRLIEASAKPVSALAWPTALVLALMLLRPSVRNFLATLSEVRMTAAAVRTEVIDRAPDDVLATVTQDFRDSAAGTWKITAMFSDWQ